MLEQVTFFFDLKRKKGNKFSIVYGTSHPDASLKKIGGAILLSLAWTIWKERNKMCFEGKKEQLQSLKHSLDCLRF